MILDKQEILDYLKEIKPELEAEGGYINSVFWVLMLRVKLLMTLT